MYEGIFFNEKTAKILRYVRKFHGESLDMTVPVLHVTTAYEPKVLHKDLYGETVSIEIVGYGNNGSNEGFSCRFETGNPRLKKIFEGIQIPHITLSHKGKAKDTALLKFEPLPVRYVIRGVFDNSENIEKERRTI